MITPLRFRSIVTLKRTIYKNYPRMLKVGIVQQINHDKSSRRVSYETGFPFDLAYTCILKPRRRSHQALAPSEAPPGAKSPTNARMAVTSIKLFEKPIYFSEFLVVPSYEFIPLHIYTYPVSAKVMRSSKEGKSRDR